MNRVSLALVPATIIGLTALAFAQPAPPSAPAKPAAPTPAPNAAPPKTEPTLPPEQQAVVQAAAQQLVALLQELQALPLSTLREHPLR